MNVNSKRLSEQLSLELRKRILEAHGASEILLGPTNQTIRSSRSDWDLTAAQSDNKHDVTVTLRLTEQEDAVINEYARVCGETVSELIRKSLIREATLADGYGADDPQYEYEIIPADDESSRSISSDHSYTNQRQRLEDAYNRMRSILGWRRINF